MKTEHSCQLLLLVKEGNAGRKQGLGLKLQLVMTMLVSYDVWSHSGLLVSNLLKEIHFSKERDKVPLGILEVILTIRWEGSWKLRGFNVSSHGEFALGEPQRGPGTPGGQPTHLSPGNGFVSHRITPCVHTAEQLLVLGTFILGSWIKRGEENDLCRVTKEISKWRKKGKEDQNTARLKSAHLDSISGIPGEHAEWAGRLLILPSHPAGRVWEEVEVRRGVLCTADPADPTSQPGFEVDLTGLSSSSLCRCGYNLNLKQEQSVFAIE